MGAGIDAAVGWERAQVLNHLQVAVKSSRSERVVVSSAWLNTVVERQGAGSIDTGRSASAARLSALLS